MSTVWLAVPGRAPSPLNKSEAKRWHAERLTPSHIQLLRPLTATPAAGGCFSPAAHARPSSPWRTEAIERSAVEPPWCVTPANRHGVTIGAPLAPDAKPIMLLFFEEGTASNLR